MDSNVSKETSLPRAEFLLLERFIHFRKSRLIWGHVVFATWQNHQIFYSEGYLGDPANEPRLHHESRRY